MGVDVPEDPRLVKLMGSPIEYKGFYVFFQRVLTNFFQYIIFRDGNFYQAYYVIADNTGEWTEEEMKKHYVQLLSMAQATCDMLLEKDRLLQKEAEKKDKTLN